MGLPERRRVDWAAPVNAGYRRQLASRAADLVQLFPGAAYGKNGADARLAVDAVEDMFRPQTAPESGCAEFGSMPTTTLTIQVWALCTSASRAGQDRWLHPGA